MKTATSFFIILLFTQLSLAQQIDWTYRPSAIKITTNNIYTLQSDGKMVVAGNFIYANGEKKYSIARINNDGTIDEAFDAGQGPDNWINNVCIGTNHKIFVSGNFKNFNGISANGLVRLNSDGSVDETFNAGSGPNGQINGIDSASGGKVLVFGNFNKFNGTSVASLVRLNADGSVDNTFNPTLFVPGSILELKTNSDGAIYLLLDGYNIIKLTSDGYADGSFTFGTHDISVGSIFDMLVQDDGIVIGGGFNNVDSSGNDNLVKILNTGILDTTFHTGDKIKGQVFSIAQLPTGEIITGGGFMQYGNDQATLISLNSDGSLKSILATSYTNAIHFVGINSAANELFVGGEFTVFNGTECYGLVKLDNYNSLNTGYHPQFFDEGSIDAMALDMNNKLIVSGTYDKIMNEQQGIARINPDGSLDSLFNDAFTGNSQVTAMRALNDGSLIVAGNLHRKDNGDYLNLAKLNANGSFNSVFGTGITLNSPPNCLAIDKNGKILVGGYFFASDPISTYGLLRLNTDGSVDHTFNPVFESGTNINDIVISASGKIYLAGDVYIGGLLTNRIIRLNEDGQIDPGFSVNPMPDNNVFTVREASDGKVYIGGFFQNVDGSVRKNLARLNTDGSLDTSFDIGSGFNNYPDNSGVIYGIGLGQNGRVYAGGQFNMYNGSVYHGVIRLDSTGAPDIQYDFSDLDYPTRVKSIIVTPNDIYIGGVIVEKDSGLAQVVMHLDIPPDVPSSLVASRSGAKTINISWQDNSTDETGFVLEKKKEGDTGFNLLASLGVNVHSYTDLTGEFNTVYHYRVKAVRNTFQSAYSNEDTVLTLLPAPSISGLDSVSQSGAFIEWDPVDGATFYQVQVSTDSFSTLAPGFENYTQDGTNLSLGSLNENTEYFIRVSAGNNVNYSLFSGTEVFNTWPAPPVSPSGLTAGLQNSGTPLIHWTDNSDNENGFILEKKSGGSGFRVLDTLSANVTLYFDSATEFNSEYIYRVKAFRNGSGSASGITVESGPSNTDTVYTLLITPVNVSIDSVRQTTARLTWSSVEGAGQYIIEISVDTFKTFIPGIGNQTKTGTGLSLDGLSENTQYEIRIMAFNSHAYSLFSDTLEFNTWPAAPAAPDSLTVVAGEADSVTLQWRDHSGNEDGFYIENKAGTAGFAVIDSVHSNVTLFRDVITSFNVENNYRVTAFRKGKGTAAGVTVLSDPSNTGSITVTALREDPSNSTVRIYPNPSPSVVYVSLGREISSPVPYRLYTLNGHLLESSTLDRNRDFIDLSRYARGVYILSVNYKGIFISRRIIRD